MTLKALLASYVHCGMDTHLSKSGSVTQSSGSSNMLLDLPIVYKIYLLNLDVRLSFQALEFRLEKQSVMLKLNFRTSI